MTRLRNPSFHRNATLLFDGGQLKSDPAARQARARFGWGVLPPYVPYVGRMPFTATEEAEAMAMFRRKPTEADWVDYHAFSADLDHRLGDDMQFTGACG
jgi:hypothetical protein